jgi:hypothetical protein
MLNSSVTAVANNLVNPVTYQYNIGVERQLPANLFLAVRYVGARSNKLYANQQYNYFSGLTGQRLNPAYGPVIATGNFADSNYNSLQIEAAHLFSHGLQIRGNYTYSKTLDDGSEVYAIGSSSPTSYSANLAPGGRGQDYGNSVYDHRNYFVLSYVWSPAGLRSGNAIANAALGALTRHWTLSGITKFQSGAYSTIALNGLDNNGDGSNANDRPIVGNSSAPLDTAAIDGSIIGATPGVYYDVAAINSTNTYNPVSASSVHWLIPNNLSNQYLHQEIGRNSYANPGIQFHDIALEKGIGLSYLHLERGQLVLRAEVQNIGNHNNVGPLDTNVLDIGTGNYFNRQNAIEDAGRTMVLWAKIAF